MKRWLITMGADEDLERLREDAAAEGATIGDAPPVPLDEGEQVVECEGPDDLPAKLESHPSVRKVSPDSEITF